MAAHDNADLLSPCLEWAGKLDGNGYGEIYMGCFNNKRLYKKAHRIAYGEDRIPNGWVLHHWCKNKTCVNPDHMSPMTRTQHMRIHAPTIPAICHEGHPLVGRNVIWRHHDGGQVRCRICTNTAVRRNHHRRKAVA